MNPDTWNANKLFFEQQFDSPLCWPNSTSVKGGYATWCVCGQTAAASGTSGTMQTESVTATVFPTKSGPTQAAGASDHDEKTNVFATSWLLAKISS